MTALSRVAARAADRVHGIRLRSGRRGRRRYPRRPVGRTAGGETAGRSSRKSSRLGQRGCGIGAQIDGKEKVYGSIP
jgi:hypothetical protein